MASGELRGEPVGYPVAYASARARLSAAQTEQGRYAESGVAVGSFSALRSIPFRVAYSRWDWANAHFPNARNTTLLDLRLARRRAGDVSASQRDRYLFLETILAARERIFLSWISRDALTGQTLEPSPVIRELKIDVCGYLGAAELDRLTTIHPASSYDREYFPDLHRGPAPAGNLSVRRSPRPSRGADGGLAHGLGNRLRRDSASGRRSVGIAGPAGSIPALPQRCASLQMPSSTGTNRQQMPVKSRSHLARFEGTWSARCRAPRVTRWG